MHQQQSLQILGFQINQYKCVSLIGVGSFAKIYKGISKLNQKKIVALKIIEKKKIYNEKSQKLRALKQKLIRTEVQQMQKCNSQHVVKCYQKFQTQQHFIFILQYCNNGDLSQHILHKKKIPEVQAIRILKQIILGFSELHKHNIIHRDLKSENIFKHNQKYKIGDLGFAKTLGNFHQINQGSVIGSLNTIAPQILNRGKYGIKADLWSLGILYYQMLCGKYPYKAYSSATMLHQIFNKPIDWQGISQQSKDLLSKLLVINPEERLSWSELYLHKIFKKYKGLKFLENYEQDVNLQESYKIHSNLKKNSIINNISEQLSRVEQMKLSQNLYQNPIFRKQNQQEVLQDKNKLSHLEEINNQIKLYIEQLNFQKDKSLLLHQGIIKPIQSLPIPKNRFFYELLYLLSSRAFFIVSPIFTALKQKQNKFNWQYYLQFLQSNISQGFLNEFYQHYNQINSLFHEMSEKISKTQNQYKSILHDFVIRKIYNKNFKEKERFFCGIEAIDFTLDQHVKFTVDYYINQLKKIINGTIQKMNEQQNEKSNEQIFTLVSYLENYEQIIKAKFLEKSNSLIHLHL